MPKELAAENLGIGIPIRRCRRIVIETQYDDLKPQPGTVISLVSFEHETLVISQSSGKKLTEPRNAGSVLATESDLRSCASFEQAYADLSALAHRLMDLQEERLSRPELPPANPPVLNPEDAPLPESPQAPSE